MGDSRALPGFGQLDLDIEDDADGTPPRGTPISAFGDAAFGDGADFDVPPDPVPEEHLSPPSTSRVFGTAPTRRNMNAVHEASTRVLEGDLLARMTSTPPGDGDGSDVAQGDRVAAMRELYAQGDAAGALALAEDISGSLRPDALAPGDHPDASIVVDFGDDASLELSDPFGGLEPLEPLEALEPELDDERGIVPTLFPSVPPPSNGPPSAAPHLTLTERHSIPRSLKSMGEIAKLPIDHRAGFLLAHVDGMQTLEEILDVCAMPATEALSLIQKLEELGVIAFE
jgi:hypothetical protein